MATARQSLARLTGVFDAYGAGSAVEKRELLGALASAELATSAEVLRLHEVLCFLRAYPDDAEVLARAERMLGAFERRRDLRRHRRALVDSGIAGTALHFPFFAAPARRLAERWGPHLSIDWSRFDGAPRLLSFLPNLTLYAERAAFDDSALDRRTWLRRFVGTGETDAAFVVRAWHALPADEGLRSALYDDLDPALRLAPGPDTPCRTREKAAGFPVAYQSRSLSRERPALKSAVKVVPLSVTDVSAREADALIELAQNAMLPRERDLEVFAYGNRDDVRVVDAGDGLAFACIGVVPERRSLLEAVYGFLMLKNGVAIGYALASALFQSSEMAYNVFETFRGGETAHMFGRLLAATKHLLGSNSFAIDPYQLGHHNAEGIASGAFWFYQKLGFEPRQPEVKELMDRELARIRKQKGYRSNKATLKKLASAYVFWPSERGRRDVLGALSTPNVALHVSRFVADRFGADRERARKACLKLAAERTGLGAADLRGFTPAERQAWERWAPLLAVIRGLESWSAMEKGALVEVVRAKGAPRESDFVRPFDAHVRLREAVRRLATEAGG